MNTINEPFIHIGFHKTGSTFLQQHLFSSVNHGFNCPWTNSSGEAIENFVLTNPYCFKPNIIRESFCRAVQEKADGNKNQLIPVISHEGLSGSPNKGRYDEFIIAQRLVQVFPRAKIIMIVREQQSMIKSFYNQYVAQGGEFSLKQFIGDELWERPGFLPILRLEYLKYHLLVSYYIELFGPDSVLVLPYELLKHNQLLFCQKLYAFTENQKAIVTSSKSFNVSLGAIVIELRRYLNSFPGKLPPLWKDYKSTPLLWRIKNKFCVQINKYIPDYWNKKLSSRLDLFIEKRVNDYYRNSNHNLQKYIDYDLNELGYKLN